MHHINRLKTHDMTTIDHSTARWCAYFMRLIAANGGFDSEHALSIDDLDFPTSKYTSDFRKLFFLNFCPIKITKSTQMHYNDVIMGAMASQLTSLTIVYSTVCSGADQRKHQSSASLAFVRGIHRWPVNSPHKWPVTRKMILFDDAIMEPVGIQQSPDWFMVFPGLNSLGDHQK